MTSDESGSDANMLNMIPVRTCHWYVSTSTGRCIIRKKRFGGAPSRYQKFFMRLLGKDDYFRICLDEKGSNIFRLIDGEKDVRAIGGIIKGESGKATKQLFPRIAAFLTNMESNGLIRFK
ncbi:MAG: PqqD family protein [Candidatus Thermoplasmatota archaeon]|jgi:hypothetical protein|nr:PqqD family protein [Candidatus Thermoplasmatota archaeon]MDP7265537.1 PqqD family protein [Candidatus Thermoplasmatota archaeon]